MTTDDANTTNPKEHPTDNAAKDPDDWVSGGDPMTGAQASYLKTLSEQAHDPEAYQDGLSKAEASKRIDALKERTQGVQGQGAQGQGARGQAARGQGARGRTL